MGIIICPNCHKIFYAKRNEICPPCYHCGHVLVDKRGRGRTRVKVFTSFICEGVERPAAFVDVSVGGARIVYTGSILPRETMIELDSDELEIHGKARAMWSGSLGGDVAHSGLKLY